jgi:uncharacterized membrane protein YbjE (DUF340 family)
MDQIDYIKYTIILTIIGIFLNHRFLPINIKIRIVYILIFFIGYLIGNKIQ